jgi:hypothetical protein
MPVEPTLVGTARPRQSPRRTHVSVPWAMRFAAGLGDDALAGATATELIDTRLGPRLLVHPCFLAGALENPLMFLSTYAVGLTRREASAVVHASVDSLFAAPLRPGAALSSSFGIVGAAGRRAGVVLTTQIEHREAEGRGGGAAGEVAAGALVCRSRWGCVILGQHLAAADLPPPPADDGSGWPALPAGGAAPEGAAEVTLRVAAVAAHVWEACIQDPTHGRRLQEMVSPHSDAQVAEQVRRRSSPPTLSPRPLRSCPPASPHCAAGQAGFPARTLTGVCLLARAVSALRRALGFGLAAVRRVAAAFAAPVYLDDAAVALGLRWWVAAADSSGSAVFFEVLLPTDEKGRRRQAIRGGYLEWGAEPRL